MNTERWSRFFAILTIVCGAGVVGGALLLALTRTRTGAAWMRDVHGAIADVALWLAAIIATVTTVGSLYYSLGAHYVPCELCWYQRICMYPLSVMLLIAAWRRDIAVRRYAAPLVLVGMVIATYHTQLQAYPEQRTFCDATNPCSSRYVWEFGFVSLPLMALVAFLAIGILLLFAARAVPPTDKEAS
jgi:disulfide bond formation protein DsbB